MDCDADLFRGEIFALMRERIFSICFSCRRAAANPKIVQPRRGANLAPGGLAGRALFFIDSQEEIQA